MEKKEATGDKPKIFELHAPHMMEEEIAGDHTIW
jgi:hypothetical protein